MVLEMEWVLATMMATKRAGLMVKTRSLFPEFYTVRMQKKAKGKIRKKVQSMCISEASLQS